MLKVRNVSKYALITLLPAFCSYLHGADIVFSNLHAFPKGGALGGQPHGLVEGKDGDLYGTTELARSPAKGTVFRATTGGQLVWSRAFDGTDGEAPQAELVQNHDGNFYGTTAYGGVAGLGTAFKLSAKGELVWSVAFDGENGAYPTAGLTQGQGENLYGTSSAGGACLAGTIFHIQQAKGRLTTLYTFNGLTDGVQPEAGLLCTRDGDLYGSTAYTATNSIPDFRSGFGTLYKLDRHGAFSTVHVFGTVTSSPGHSLDGAHPLAKLIQTADGNIYGTTPRGGQYDFGTVFRLGTDGSFTTIYSFSGHKDGAWPLAPLLLASDGNLYGTTQLYDADSFRYGYGTVFRITPDGAFETLVWFNGPNGAFPEAGLIQATDGNLYGTTAGGFYSPGTIFRLSIPTGPAF